MTLPPDSLACILSCSGPALTPEERGFFAEAKPLGFILFKRNCENPQQLKALTDELRAAVGWDCPILIDQEGGRVQRLGPPGWRTYFAAKIFGDMGKDRLPQAEEDLRCMIFQMARDLRDAGVNVNCAPVLDILMPETHQAIGDRAFSDDPEIVSALGLAACRHYLNSGITPVIKHMPGQGRAPLDSHEDLPVVSAARESLESSDFKPFKDIAAADIAPRVWGMTAHVIYSALDADHPASLSPTIIGDIIRGYIGFDGFLLSDDLDMEALAGYGPIEKRAALAVEAGCDAALYCWAKLDIMEKIAKTVPKLSPKAQERLQNAQ